MSLFAPLYVCPDCEPGPYWYAGKIIAKMCSACADARRNAQTGFDRARTGADRPGPRVRGLGDIVRRLTGGS